MQMANIPTINQFISEISNIIKEKNGAKLQDYLVIEPPYSNLYNAMIDELKRVFPRGNEDQLETKCSNSLSDIRSADDNTPWTAFTKFMVQYFCFLRDVNIENLLDTYNLLSDLVQKCNSALAHGSLGILILPTVVTYCRMLSRLAIGLDKSPELIAHLTKQSTDEGGARETLPERAANIVRQAFVTCLNDRAGGIRDGKPEGKKIGIYKMANLCLKILFQCGKPRNAEQIFVNIDNQSPPLAIYPRSERVTYLYYLGRFLFANNHFFRAQAALQEAYGQCHSKCHKQRRLILIYLITSNIILGRFPTQALYQRQEAFGFQEKFHPICLAIAKGDLTRFRKFLGPNSPYAEWFLHHKILVQLRNRCEVLVWRSLLRKTFLINGSQGDNAGQNAGGRRAPTFNLADVLHLGQVLEKRALPPPPKGSISGRHHANRTAIEERAFEGYCDPDLVGAEGNLAEALLPDMLEVESIISSLVDQQLLNGYIAHKLLRFAILGTKTKGALAAGFPNVWQTISKKSSGEVPGWKKAGGPVAQKLGAGTVVNLSGAKPAGDSA